MQETHSNSQPPCRICLQSAPQTDLIHPCRCSGSSKNIHEKCLLQWIQKLQQTNSESKPTYSASHNCHTIQCQVCKQKIELFLSYFTVKNAEEIQQMIKNNKISFIFHVFGIVSIVTFIIFLGVQYETILGSRLEIYKYLIVGVIIFLGLCGIGLIGNALGMFFVQFGTKYGIVKDRWHKVAGGGKGKKEQAKGVEDHSAIQLRTQIVKVRSRNYN